MSVKASPSLYTSYDMLFKQWQDEMVRRSLPNDNYKDRFLDTWIHWAIVAMTQSDGVGRFRTNFDVWLNSILHCDSEFKKQWEPVAWVKALLELNPDAYSRVVKRWQTAHHCRREVFAIRLLQCDFA